MPVTRRKNQALISIFSILLILAIDQYSKLLVRLKFTVGESLPLIRNIFHITYVSNKGAAFGLFKNFTLIFIMISIVVIVYILLVVLKSIKGGKFLSDPIINFGLILIIAGALGNLIDRLKFGYVTDFLDFRIWPVFNIADIAITIGTFFLILSFLSRKNCP
ncbi:MAG: signal peptidase II [Candidatus Omnitrophica bacterium]|nr:signal peptidase II [Candidatus Omnitrophota bacterium]